MRLRLALLCTLLSLASASGCGSAQPVTASPPQTSPLEFIGEWGMQGENPGELADPVGLAVDLTGQVYLADRRSGLLQKFEPSGVPLLAYADASVRGASALAVDSGGAIYLADARSGRIWIHLPDGELLRNFRVTPQRTDDSAYSFCVTAEGKIVVPDPGGARLEVFTPTGRLESTWAIPASDGKPARPIAAAAGLDEFVYVADAASGRIAKYTSRGEPVAVWEAPPDAAGPIRGLAVSRNHVFALRGQTPQLEVWTFGGRLVLAEALGERFGAEPPATLYLAVTQNEQVFVLDPARRKVMRFQLKPSSQ